MTTEALRLNIGAKDTVIEGFTPVDRKLGQEAYPLDYPDNTVDEIRASHVLEHFPYEQNMDVLKDWVRALKPGGLLRVAMPDFGKLAHAYVKDEIMPYQNYIMGGHTDSDDYHGTIIDREGLEKALFEAGLQRLRTWKSEIEDCAAFPWSLNLMGYKPTHPVDRLDNVGAILACPRFGPVMHFRAITELVAIGTEIRMVQGCFWWQQLCEGMELHLKVGHEYILTVDYDSVFKAADVLELYRILLAFPDIDAVCAMQCKRGGDKMLFSLGEEALSSKALSLASVTKEVKTGHFGLTLFRASSLRDHERPWMTPIPNPEGLWSDGHVDVDVDFWHRWEAAGKTLHMANRVPIGHMDETITWPGKDMRPQYQNAQDYLTGGIPEEAWQ